MSYNTKIRRRLRKGAGGLGTALQAGNYASQAGSQFGNALFPIEPNDKGYMDYENIALNQGFQNLGYGLPGMAINMFTTGKKIKDAKAHNAELDKYYNQIKGQDMLGRQEYVPGQEAYTPLMPYGGQVGGETVELEKGEPYILPDGNINSISMSAPTHTKGGVPITLPYGSRVLGKKKSLYGKTFKELGRKLEKQQNRYNKALDTNPTSIAANTAKRMIGNIQKKYNKLFEEQGEDIHTIMPDGGEVGALYKGDPRIRMYGYTPEQFRMAPDSAVLSQVPYFDPKTKQLLGYKEQRKNMPGPVNVDINPYEEDNTGTFLFNNKRLMSGSEIPEFGKGGSTGKSRWIQKATASIKRRGTKGKCTPITKPGCTGRARALALTFKKMARNRKGQYGLETGYDNELINTRLQPSGYNVPNPNEEYGIEPWMINPNSWGNTNNDFNFSPYTMGTIGNTNTSDYNTKPSFWNKIGQGAKNTDWGNVANTAGALSPMIYNVLQGLQKPDKWNAKDYMNPYGNTARSLMRSRRYNIRPELRQQELERATFNRGLREQGFSSGQRMGGMQAASLNKSRLTGETLARAQNMNNQYRGEQAQTDIGLGRDIAQTRMAVRDVNDRNKAAQRAYMGTGLSQLSQYSQMRQLQNNQILRDAQRLNLLPSLFQNFYLDGDGFIRFKENGKEATPEDLTNYINGLNK